jgi:hypothetical protein
MIFIVVKHPVRPELADNWPSLVEGFTSATLPHERNATGTAEIAGLTRATDAPGPAARGSGSPKPMDRPGACRQAAAAKKFVVLTLEEPSHALGYAPE